MSSAAEGRAASADNSDNGSVNARIGETEYVNQQIESQTAPDEIHDVVDSSTVPLPGPPARSPTERLREKMNWDAGISPPLPSTRSMSGTDEVETANVTDVESQMDLAAAVAPPLVRTPSMRLRQKLMSGGSYEEVGRSSNTSDRIGVQRSVESTKAPAEVESIDRKCSHVTTGLDDDDVAVPNNNATNMASVEALPATEPVLTRPVTTNTNTHRSNNVIPDKRAARISDQHDTVTDTVERIVLPVDTEATRNNRRVVRPGAYAVAGIGRTDSTSRTSRGTSTTHSDAYVETPHNDITRNANSPADALAAYCVEEQGVVATGVVVESELEGSKGDASPLWVKYRYCIIALGVIILILVILGATGVFSSNDNGGISTPSPFGQIMNADEVPESTFKEVAYKIGSFPGAKFGVSVAMQGKRLAVATHESEGTDSVAVYDLNSTHAFQVGQIIPGVKGDVQGRLSKNGRRLVVGEEKSDGRFGVDDDIGQTRVFELNETSNLWEPVGQTIYGDKVKSRAGKDVSISSKGDVIATGMPFQGSFSGGDGLGAGAVRAYKFSGSGWEELGSGIFGANEEQRLGWSVALSNEGMTLVVGSRWNRTIDESTQIVTLKVGSLNVYTFNEDVKDWVQIGQPIFGVSFDDIFGARSAVNSDGSVIAGGAYHNDDAAPDSGHVRVYRYNQYRNSWDQMGSTITGILAEDNVAPLALSADGKRIAIGAPDFNSDTGYAKVYDYVNTDWVLVGGGVIKGHGRNSVMGFDVALSQDGYRLAVGSRTHLGEYGIVRVFELPERLQ